MYKKLSHKLFVLGFIPVLIFLMFFSKIFTNEKQSNIKIRETTFYGLASYYNNSRYYLFDGNEVFPVEEHEKLDLNKSLSFLKANRLNVNVIKIDGLQSPLYKEVFQPNNANRFDKLGQPDKVVKNEDLGLISEKLQKLKYIHLWSPLASLCLTIERFLIDIHNFLCVNWGVAIIILCIIIKLFTLPISLLTLYFQRQVSQIQSKLNPIILDIKSKYDGEQAHNLIMSAHKDLGITPFYSLKPMIGSLVQIPILIAVFNVLGVMSQFDGEEFLWINNLAYPDSIFILPFYLPGLGNTVNLLPVIMTLITIFSTTIFRNKHLDLRELRKQKEISI
ncbi:YidC/Oxa1 family membrane protein insertase [Legionella tunisiensis]|uniref:YidC/Oxa1 family membrane protein insertase n=1 Tax=Legionella tunisiensis TaxID=1034944 RepID=UPI0002F3A169|nr:YidC/Oxa1 family membrane protein insertase [Legionella tunisiensis]